MSYLRQADDRFGKKIQKIVTNSQKALRPTKRRVKQTLDKTFERQLSSSNISVLVNCIEVGTEALGLNDFRMPWK